jgi:hypothetical protein
MFSNLVKASSVGALGSQDVSGCLRMCQDVSGCVTEEIWTSLAVTAVRPSHHFFDD